MNRKKIIKSISQGHTVRLPQFSGNKFAALDPWDKEKIRLAWRGRFGLLYGELLSEEDCEKAVLQNNLKLPN